MLDTRNHDRELTRARHSVNLRASALADLIMLVATLSACADCGGVVEKVGRCITEGGPIETSVVFGDIAVSDGLTLEKFRYSCSTNNGETGDYACFDPDTPRDEWLTDDWLVYLSVNIPSESGGCEGMSVGFWVALECGTDGLPDIGNTYDLSDVSDSAGWVRTAAGDVWYELTAGTLAIVDASLDSYKFEVTGIQLIKLSGADEYDAEGCYLPLEIEMDSIAPSCIPAVEEVTWC